jgi:hypothetical protein
MYSTKVHVTVVPTLIRSRFGENALLPSVAAPFVIETLFELEESWEEEDGTGWLFC